MELGTLGGFVGAARAVSEDGSVIVGNANDAYNRRRAFRWTAQTGPIDLGGLGGKTLMKQWESPGDGSIVIGFGLDQYGRQVAFRWTEQTGMRALPYPGRGRFLRLMGSLRTAK